MISVVDLKRNSQAVEFATARDGVNRFIGRGTVRSCVLLVLASFACAGCGLTGKEPGVPVVSPPAQGANGSLGGTVYGGPNPVSGATVQVYATSSGGYGAAPALLGTATTNSRGYFSFASLATCPAGQQAYITAYGGDPGSGGNANYLTMAALGNCAGIVDSTTVFINEVTTVAAAYALGQFTVITGSAGAPVVQIGAPAANNASSGSCTVTSGVTTGCTGAGLAHAFANALNLASSINIGSTQPTGMAYRTTPSNPDGQVPTAVVNALANSLVSCVNSKGGTAGDGSPCGTLFADATPAFSGAAAPVNTLQALIDIAQSPAPAGARVSGIFNLATPQTSFFTPTLGAAPADWSLGIVYTGVNLAGVDSPVSNPFNLTLDANDQAYVSRGIGNPATSSQVLAFAANGASLWASTPNTNYTTVRTIASDTIGHVWMVNSNSTVAKNALLGFNTVDGSTYETLPVSVGSAFGLAVDLANNLWFSSLSTTSQSLFELQRSNSYGMVTLANPPNFGNQAYAVAVDANGNIWTANSASSGNSSVGVFPNTGSVSAPAYGAAALTAALTGVSANGLALDASNNAWTATASGFAKVTPAFSGARVTSLSATYPGVSSVQPKFLAVDGQGTVWVPDQASNTLIEYVPLTQLSQTLQPCYVPAGATVCSSALSTPKRAQVDSAGSLWIAGSATGVTQLLGPGAPTTPLATLLGGTGGSGSATATLSQSSLTFASTTQSTSSTPQAVTLTNSGTATLAITSIAVGGTNASSFSQENNCGSTLAAGGTCTISVLFTPRATGTLSANVVVTDNASNSPQSLSLSGTGTAAAAALTFSPTSLGFGSVAVGTTSAAQTVMLTNSGTASLTIGSIALSGTGDAAYSEVSQCGSTLAAGSSCNVNVSFAPAAGGSLSANLAVTDSAANSPQSVELSGSGNAGTSGSTFVNPLFDKADPSIVLYNGLYYYVESGCSHTGTQPVICLRSASNIPDLGSAKSIPVFQMPPNDTFNQDVWAPQIENFGGNWYIQYASDNGGIHHLFAAVPSNESSPLSAYSWTVAPTGDANGNGQIPIDWVSGNAIDPDVFMAHDGNYYLVYSCYQGSGTPQAQSICIAEMSDPNHVMVNPVTGKAVSELSYPTQNWENRSLAVMEGPFGYTVNGVDYIFYSCSFSGTPDDYCTGMLVNNGPPQVNGTGNPLLNPASWVKFGPVFDGHHSSYGTGSVVLVNSPDNTQLWNVYHGTDCLTGCDTSSGNTWPDRSIRAQKAGISALGVPLLGYPVDITNTDGTGSDVPLAVPSFNGSGSNVVYPAWGQSFGDLAIGSGLGQVVGSWTANGNSMISSTSLDAKQLDQDFYESNPNYQNYVLYTNLQQNAAGTGDNSPGYGVYAAYVGHANYLTVMINPSSTNCGTFGCVTTNAAINGAVQTTKTCALPAGFNPAATNLLVVQAVSGTYTLSLNGTALTGGCQGQTFSFVDGQEGNHGTNGQVGVIAENTEATYSNFTVSPGVPLDSTAYPMSSSGNPPQTCAFRNLASTMQLDNSCDGGCNGPNTNGAAVIQYPPSSTYPAAYPNNTDTRQLWTLSAQANGYFTITNTLSGKCLEDPYGNATPSRTLPQAQGVSTMAWQQPCSGGAKQNWKFVPLPIGSSFMIVNQASSLALDSFDTNQGTQTWLTAPAGTTAQTWQLIVQ